MGEEGEEGEDSGALVYVAYKVLHYVTSMIW